MPKLKRKLTKEQKIRKREAKEERQKKFKWVLINGKQVRIKREPIIDDVSVDYFVLENADSIFLHQNEMWEYIDGYSAESALKTQEDENKDTLPF